MTGSRVPIALVGIGKIARDQHVPTLAASTDFELVAAVTHHAPPEGVPGFTSITEMTAVMPEVRAVSICTPPRGRLALVREAVEAGLDVMMEKPPAATLSEAQAFADLARTSGRVLFATWHSREAAGVDAARQWCHLHKISRVDVAWKEDVRVWHPGQEWIWEPGIGVFDPGINALSVITRILPRPLMLEEAELRFPANRQAPIAASLGFVDAQGMPVAVEFNFDQRGPQSWDIVAEAVDGRLTLSMGGARLEIDGRPVSVPEGSEYARLYRRFAELVRNRESDIDLSPFRYVADAFLLGRRVQVDAFEWSID